MLWRLHLRTSPKNGKTQNDVVEFCIQNNIAGIGWPVTPTPATPSEYASRVREQYGKSTASVAFAIKISPGDLVWARSRNGEYYLGRIDPQQGDWRYSDDPLHIDLDIPNQRSCHWRKIGNEANVPGKIVACFRPVNAFQAIADPQMERYSEWLYANPEGTTHVVSGTGRLLEPSEFFRMISAEDCEDIVGLYLQKIRGYCLIPSTCKRTTIGYEFILQHGETGETAAVQVKQGGINLDDRLKDVADHIYLFSTEGTAVITASNIEILTRQQLYDFVMEYSHVMPLKIRFWLFSGSHRN